MRALFFWRTAALPAEPVWAFLFFVASLKPAPKNPETLDVLHWKLGKAADRLDRKRWKCLS
jgi:hypothetical protein